MLARTLPFIVIAACAASAPQAGAVGLTTAGEHAEAPILIHEVEEHTDPVHAKGLRPTHHASVDGDKMLFTHRYQHHDPVSDRLTYYQYHARRHDHVVVLSRSDVRSCTAMPTANDNFTSLTLDLAVNMSDLNLTIGGRETP